jgi:hypothetical protein
MIGFTPGRPRSAKGLRTLTEDSRRFGRHLHVIRVSDDS